MRSAAAKVAAAAEKAKQEKISWADYEQVELEVAAQLAQKIKKEIPGLTTTTIQADINQYWDNFDLAVVVKERKTYCLGYTEIFYNLGNATGLTVRGLLVGAHADSQQRAGVGHNACLVKLHEGKVVQVDLTFKEPISRPFLFRETYAKVGGYWELKENKNPLHLHRKVQVQHKKEIVAAIFMMRGCADRRAGNLTEAIAKQTKAIELNPNFAEAYINRANALLDMKKYSHAISDCNQAAELNPLFPDSYYLRGKANASLGKPQMAIPDYSKAIDIDSKYANAFMNRGDAYFQTGKHSQALADYNRLIELKPNDAAAYIRRGNAYGESRRYTEAIADYNQSIAINPKYSLAYYNRGTAYAFAGRMQDATNDLRKALELDPKMRPDVDKIASRFGLGL